MGTLLLALGSALGSALMLGYLCDNIGLVLAYLPSGSMYLTILTLQLYIQAVLLLVMHNTVHHIAC